jgi:hypothetical protein
MNTHQFLVLWLVLALASLKAPAQSREVPGVAPIIRPGTTALMQYHIVPKFTVIQSHNKQYLISAEGLKHMKTDWVSTTKIWKDSASVAPYGSAATRGIAVRILDDADHPEAFKILKPWLTPINTKNRLD